jgi:hypothetical protein
MFHLNIFVHKVDWAESKQFRGTSGLAIMCISKNQQQAMVAAFNSKGNALQRFCQGPSISTIMEKEKSCVRIWIIEISTQGATQKILTGTETWIRKANGRWNIQQYPTVSYEELLFCSHHRLVDPNRRHPCCLVFYTSKRLNYWRVARQEEQRLCVG